jgi:hypothetical protein
MVTRSPRSGKAFGVTVRSPAPERADEGWRAALTRFALNL